MQVVYTRGVPAPGRTAHHYPLSQCAVRTRDKRAAAAPPPLGRLITEERKPTKNRRAAGHAKPLTGTSPTASRPPSGRRCRPTRRRTHDPGVPRCCGAFTPSTRLVSIRRGRGWFLFDFEAIRTEASDRDAPRRPPPTSSSTPRARPRSSASRSTSRISRRSRLSSATPPATAASPTRATSGPRSSSASSRRRPTTSGAPRAARSCRTRCTERPVRAAPPHL